MELLWVQLEDTMLPIRVTDSTLTFLLLLFSMHLELLPKVTEKVCKRDAVSLNMRLNNEGFPWEYQLGND